MIISASRRTDIPAFYAEWFFERIKEGFCLVQNPMNPKSVRYIDLTPNSVDVIVFWTKNPDPIIPFLHFLDEMKYSYIFLYTLNNYPKYLEPNLPNITARLKSFKFLSGKIGADRVIWRYDPILLTNSITVDYHINTFDYLCNKLKDSTHRVIISFIDLYKHVESKLLTALPKNDYLINIDDNRHEILRLCDAFYKIAVRNNIEIASCAEVRNLIESGILPGACIDGAYLTSIFNKSFPLTKDNGQRKECLCVLSADVGLYDTCKHQCSYCYANRNLKVWNKNISEFDKAAPSLSGWIEYKSPIQKKLYL